LEPHRQDELTRLQATIAQKRSAIIALADNEPPRLEILQNVLALLDVVEANFLLLSGSHHPRTDEQWAWWLNLASLLVGQPTQAWSPDNAIRSPALR